MNRDKKARYGNSRCTATNTREFVIHNEAQKLIPELENIENITAIRAVIPEYPVTKLHARTKICAEKAGNGHYNLLEMVRECDFMDENGRRTVENKQNALIENKQNALIEKTRNCSNVGREMDNEQNIVKCNNLNQIGVNRT